MKITKVANARLVIFTAFEPLQLQLFITTISSSVDAVVSHPIAKTHCSLYVQTVNLLWPDFSQQCRQVFFAAAV